MSARIDFNHGEGEGMSHDEELRWVRRREGTHRSSSRATPGYERDLLREDDSENLLGPTESRPADIDEIVRSRRPAAPSRPTPGQELRYQLGDVIMDALEPHIARGVDAAVDAAVLGISRLWRRATSGPSTNKATVRKGAVQPPASEVLASAEPDAADIKDELDGIAIQPQSMSAEQYKALLLSALLADQYAARARQMLSNVRVDDAALPAELEIAIRAALEGPTPVIDDATLARAVEILRESTASDGEFVLESLDYVEVPRSLSDGRTQ